MTFVITQGCCNDGSCVTVCPVQCIRPRPGDPDFTTAEQLYIDPATCIDCAACLDECPVDAIHGDYDVPDQFSEYLQINADYFAENPITEEPEPDRVRRRLPEDRPSLRVAIVGSGPAACYAAGDLSEIKGVEVSVFDRLATPFGLVRSGVAPDHPDTKLMGDQFRATLARKSVSCFFNVEVGRDITVEELLEHHHAVIWAAGAGDDRRLDIPGEDLHGSHSAREFVAWYNGHPDAAHDEFDLTGERAVVIGNGNVALDVARALTRPVADFEVTDMADHAIEALRASGITDVVVAARRGPENAAYTLPEVLALRKLDGVDLVAVPAEVESAEPTSPSALLTRKLQVVKDAAAGERAADRSITLRFLLTPVSINGEERVESVTFARNEVVDTDGVVSVRPTEETETIEASLVLRAVGYRGHAVPGMPFDEPTGTIPNAEGRVLASSGGEHLTGLYCSGWIKRGATGVIGTNKVDSTETVEALLADFAAGTLVEPAADGEHLAALVTERQPDVIDNAGWVRINNAERAAGKERKRPRVKFVALEDMLAASRATT
ncbi:MAG: ferredoxin--NADP(+) reductase [Aeromicrobium sp.]|nr:ferredoxin--NADP(+) reductase [Aeromicrobium sp.]